MPLCHTIRSGYDSMACGAEVGIPSSLLTTHYSPFRLLVPRQDVVDALPGAFEVEGAELLRQLHRLVHHAFLVVVVAHLDVAGEREVLAQWVALEAVVGEDSA